VTKRSSSISKGIYRTPIELSLLADSTTRNLVALYGRIQALEIARTVHEQIERMQDQPNKKEKRALKVEKESLDVEKKIRVDSLAEEFKKLQKELKELERE
jgi:hypothetical protein